VSAWPALALAGSFELPMTLIRTDQRTVNGDSSAGPMSQPAPSARHGAPAEVTSAPSLEQTVREWHGAGRSQRAIARELKVDRRKVKQIIDRAA
jgi:hypothetical protein